MSFMQVLSEFQALCQHDDIKCATATRIFLNLQHDKRIKDLKKCYDDELNIVYVCAQRDATQQNVVFLPVLNTIDLDLWQLQRIQAKLKSSITLAICDTSSNVLYYEATAGFVEKAAK